MAIFTITGDNMKGKHIWCDVIVAMAIGIAVEYETPEGWVTLTDYAVNPFSFPHWNWRVKQNQ